MLFLRYKKAPAGMFLFRNAILRYKKAPAGMLLLRNALFEVQKSPCGHVAAQKPPQISIFGRENHSKVTIWATDESLVRGLAQGPYSGV